MFRLDDLRKHGVGPELVLTADERVYLPNSQLTASNTTQGQLAMAIAGGYRDRCAWPSGVGFGSDREGVYPAANYNYLHGFRYEDIDFRLRMDTDGAGMAIDVGVGAVVNNWELGFGANGLNDVEHWAGVAEFGRGFQGKSFHGGGEYRFGAIDVRAGAAYSRELWNPSGGVGFNMSQGTSLDLALYSNSANVERTRNPALAVSLRFNR